MRPGDFRIFAPLSFFEKASAPPGRQRRIGGVISTELLDKQGEIIVQKGLDFSPFLEEGWFNDNHSKATTDVLGYPDKAGLLRFQKGERLPDGSVASANGTWAEGWLLDTPKANDVWNLGQSLAKAGNERRLGFSIEGNARRRAGPGGRIVAEAVVKNVAITNCPVSHGTRLETLAKSLTALQRGEDEDTILRALTAGAAPAEQPAATMGPKTGEGAGRILAPQSLERDDNVRFLTEDDLRGDEKKQLTKSEALAAIAARYPTCSAEFHHRVFDTLNTLAERRLL